MSKFTKGREPWNKGKSGYRTKPASDERKQKISNALKGTQKSEEARKKMSEAKRGKKWTDAQRVAIMKTKKYGKEHQNWKGEDVGYVGLHIWLNKQHPKTGICSHCDSESVTEWALREGETYRRDVEAFWELCRSCHRRFDKLNPKKTY